MFCPLRDDIELRGQTHRRAVGVEPGAAIAVRFASNDLAAMQHVGFPGG